MQLSSKKSLETSIRAQCIVWCQAASSDRYSAGLNWYDMIWFDMLSGRGPFCVRRQRLNELHKEYWVKIKLVTLHGQWMTLISWCQKMRTNYSSPAIHNVECKPQLLLEKLTLAPKNRPYIDIFCEFFLFTSVCINFINFFM